MGPSVAVVQAWLPKVWGVPWGFACLHQQASGFAGGPSDFRHGCSVDDLEPSRLGDMGLGALWGAPCWPASQRGHPQLTGFRSERLPSPICGKGASAFLEESLRLAQSGRTKDKCLRLFRLL